MNERNLGIKKQTVTLTRDDYNSVVSGCGHLRRALAKKLGDDSVLVYDWNWEGDICTVTYTSSKKKEHQHASFKSGKLESGRLKE
jgi:hypothetical protein